MGIGNNTTWGVLRICNNEAKLLLHETDKRIALQFRTQDAAITYMRKMQRGETEQAQYYTVEIRG